MERVLHDAGADRRIEQPKRGSMSDPCESSAGIALVEAVRRADQAGLIAGAIAAPMMGAGACFGGWHLAIFVMRALS